MRLEVSLSIGTRSRCRRVRCLEVELLQQQFGVLTIRLLRSATALVEAPCITRVVTPNSIPPPSCVPTTTIPTTSHLQVASMRIMDGRSQRWRLSPSSWQLAVVHASGQTTSRSAGSAVATSSKVFRFVGMSLDVYDRRPASANGIAASSSELGEARQTHSRAARSGAFTRCSRPTRRRREAGGVRPSIRFGGVRGREEIFQPDSHGAGRTLIDGMATQSSRSEWRIGGSSSSRQAVSGRSERRLRAPAQE